MHLDYWRMKLANTYMVYRNKLYYVRDLIYDGSEIEYNECYTPEEMIENLLISLGDDDRAVSFNKVSVFLPEDQYFIGRGNTAVYAKRSLDRNYKLSATGEMYGLNQTNMNKLQNYIAHESYSPPEEVLLFDGKERVYSKNIASRREGKDYNTLYYKDIYFATASKEHGIGASSVIPFEARELFSSLINGKSDEVKSKPDPIEERSIGEQFIDAFYARIEDPRVQNSTSAGVQTLSPWIQYPAEGLHVMRGNHPSEIIFNDGFYPEEEQS